MIVWLASYPRSGNTFLRLILAQAFGHSTAALYREKLTGRMRELLKVDDPDAPPEALGRGPEPCFVKTHDLPGDDRHPALYLVRDGRDALVSYARYIQTWEAAEADAADPGEPRATAADLMRDLIVFEASFAGWGPNVERWLERRPAPVVLRFEALIADPVVETARALAELGLGKAGAGEGDPLPSFEELREQMPRSFRRGRVGGFRRSMPPEIEELFWSKYGPLMERLGYAR